MSEKIENINLIEDLYYLPMETSMQNFVTVVFAIPKRDGYIYDLVLHAVSEPQVLDSYDSCREDMRLDSSKYMISKCCDLTFKNLVQSGYYKKTTLKELQNISIALKLYS